MDDTIKFMHYINVAGTSFTSLAFSATKKRIHGYWPRLASPRLPGIPAHRRCNPIYLHTLMRCAALADKYSKAPKTDLAAELQDVQSRIARNGHGWQLLREAFVEGILRGEVQDAVQSFCEMV